jgi:hypothetical protein
LTANDRIFTKYDILYFFYLHARLWMWTFILKSICVLIISTFVQ